MQPVAANAAPPAGPSTGKETPQPAPPREPLFVDWPAPRFALVITGQQMGYIEPCGCTGLVNQKGGLSRRHTLVKQLAARGWPVVPLDVGNQVRRFGRQSEIKFQTAADGMKKIGYQAIALGADDLRLSVGELAAQTAASDGQPTPFLSANAAVIDPSLTPTHHVLTAADKKIGVTAIVSDEWQKKIIGGEILLKPAVAALDETIPKLQAAGCQIQVLLAQASIPECQDLAVKYPNFQVIVTAGGLGEPTFQPEPIPGSDTLLVQVGLKGMFAIVLGYYDDPQKPWRYQRVPLDARFDDSPEMLALLGAYQDQLQSLGLEGLGLKPTVHASGNQFVGTEKCGECHTKALEKWQETKHGHALDSLIRPSERSEIARHFDPECLCCHVVGWDPQQAIPFASGYLSLEKTPLMKHVGCENCHGPGSAHVAAEEGTGDPTPEQLERLRAAVRLPLPQAEKKCQECHDLDNSPNFHATGAFEKFWKEVEHLGKD